MRALITTSSYPTIWGLLFLQQSLVISFQLVELCGDFRDLLLTALPFLKQRWYWSPLADLKMHHEWRCTISYWKCYLFLFVPSYFSKFIPPKHNITWNQIQSLVIEPSSFIPSRPGNSLLLSSQHLDIQVHRHWLVQLAPGVSWQCFVLGRIFETYEKKQKNQHQQNMVSDDGFQIMRKHGGSAVLGLYIFVDWCYFAVSIFSTDFLKPRNPRYPGSVWEIREAAYKRSKMWVAVFRVAETKVPFRLSSCDFFFFI